MATAEAIAPGQAGGMKSSLMALLRTFSEDGRGPFQRWADGQAASGGVSGLADSHLRRQLGAAYGGNDVVEFLQRSGLGALIERDLGAVLGPARAKAISQAAIEAPPKPAPQPPSKAPAAKSGVNSGATTADAGDLWTWIGLAAILIVGVLVCIFFAGLLLRIGAALVTVAAIWALYQEGFWKIVGLAGFVVCVAMNGSADKIEGRVDPSEAGDSTAADSEYGATSACRTAAGDDEMPGAMSLRDHVEPIEGGYSVELADQVGNAGGGRCAMKFTARCEVKDGKATLTKDWSMDGYVPC